jgi:hypothetical protein
MHIRRFNHLILLFSLACCAKAQDVTPTLTDELPFGYPHWASAADSADRADFAEFRKAIAMVDETLETTTGAYRAVWHINEHGGMVWVSRGDGSLWRIEASSVIGLSMHLPFRMTDGRRGFMVVHDTPCGLICRDTVYYVEE